MKEPPKTILLVEDEALIAAREVRVLERYGFHVVTAYSGEKALAATDEHSPDLILMDIDLGRKKMDGTEAAERILKDHRLPIIFLTSHSEKEMVDRVKGITRYGYVLKNSGEFVLIEAINMAFELFDAHRRTLESEERLKIGIEATGAGLLDMDIQHDTVFYSDTFLTMLGYRSDGQPAVPDSWVGLLHPEDREEAEKKAADYLSKTVPFYESTYRMRRKDGRYIWVNDKGKAVWNIYGEPARFIRFITDITEKKALREKENRFHILFENAYDAIFLETVDDRIIDVNRKACEMMGYSREELLALKVSDLQAPKVRSRKGDALKKELKNHKNSIFEGLNIRKDGTVFPVEISNALVSDNQDTFIISFVRDISERKEYEDQRRESEEKYRNLVESSPDGIITMSLSGKVLSVNRAFLELTGYERAESFVGIHFLSIPTLFKKDLEEYAEILKSVVTGIAKKRIIFNWRHASGERRVGEAHMGLIHNKSKKIMLQAILRDITDQKKYEEKLQNALDEKNSLMQELNHRVKNNLLMVSALVRMKNAELGENCDISDLEHKIDAIRILHEHIKPEETPAYIGARTYIHDILKTVFSSFSEQPVQCDEEIEDITLSTRKAIPLGMIINEIATNAIKHGFPGEKDAKFQAYLQTTGDHRSCTVRLSNSGQPFPEEIDLENQQTLGLRLIVSLTAQIGGTVSLKKVPFPEYTITFPTEDS
ncbi:MAG: PAS domain S-box protein [Spirochaetales bacterium]|nr:PAS domain S-box protein [Spirochaetales bacterium]